MSEENNQPMVVDVEEGKDYFWCSCGKSAKQPFCDGSHKDTEFKPVKYLEHQLPDIDCANTLITNPGIYG